MPLDSFLVSHKEYVDSLNDFGYKIVFNLYSDFRLHLDTIPSQSQYQVSYCSHCGYSVYSWVKFYVHLTLLFS